jgi:hypothetical protein
MGAAHDTTRTGWGAALIDVPTPTADVRTGRRVWSDVFVLEGLGTILVIAAWSRHEFLGDRVRPAVPAFRWCPPHHTSCVAIDTAHKYWHYLSTSPTSGLSLPVRHQALADAYL